MSCITAKSEGFGYIRTKYNEGTDYPINWPRVLQQVLVPLPVEVRYKNGLHSQVGRLKIDDWYDNGPYTIVAWRPIA